jgi:hypothetical protein
MATGSRDRNDALLPKIWTPASLRAHEREQRRLSMNQHAALSKFTRVKPEDKGGGLRDLLLYCNPGIAGWNGS